MNGERQAEGVWRFALEGQVRATPRYGRNTPILVTRLEAADGSAVDVIDFCPRSERSGRMYRPVAYTRIVRPVAGSPSIRMNLSPMRHHRSEEHKSELQSLMRISDAVFCLQKKTT